jgi:hypothetical protein
VNVSSDSQKGIFRIMVAGVRTVTGIDRARCPQGWRALSLFIAKISSDLTTNYCGRTHFMNDVENA